jgi:hypothetical protein
MERKHLQRPDAMRVNGRPKPQFNGAANAHDYLSIIQIFAVA